jgi:hypothetical protein
MLAALEKHWSVISMVLLLTLLASFVFLPLASSPLSIALLALGLSTAIFFIVRRHLLAYRAGEIDRRKLARNLALELGGMVLTMGLAMLLSRLTISYLGKHLSGTFGLVVSLLAALAVGIVTGFLVQKTWGRLLAK